MSIEISKIPEDWFLRFLLSYDENGLNLKKCKIRICAIWYKLVDTYRLTDLPNAMVLYFVLCKSMSQL
jgi:hypothetical protein